MNFIQQQLEKQKEKDNKLSNKNKKGSSKLLKPTKNFKPMRAK